jgi:hypothetical protein
MKVEEEDDDEWREVPFDEFEHKPLNYSKPKLHL